VRGGDVRGDVRGGCEVGGDGSHMEPLPSESAPTTVKLQSRDAELVVM
jgi:hypothetical protein